MLLSVFAKAFKTPDLRRKIFFTLGIMALFRFGSVIPTPGVSYGAVQRCLANVDTGGLFGLINLFPVSLWFCYSNSRCFLWSSSALPSKC